MINSKNVVWNRTESFAAIIVGIMIRIPLILKSRECPIFFSILCIIVNYASSTYNCNVKLWITYKNETLIVIKLNKPSRPAPAANPSDQPQRPTL